MIPILAVIMQSAIPIEIQYVTVPNIPLVIPTAVVCTRLSHQNYVSQDHVAEIPTAMWLTAGKNVIVALDLLETLMWDVEKFRDPYANRIHVDLEPNVL